MGVGVKLPAWSFSSLKGFLTCPKQYYHLRVAKDYISGPTAATLYGTEFHKACEDYVRDETSLDTRFAHVKPLLDALRKLKGERFCELKMALNDKLEACEFFAKDCFVRGIGDLIILQREKGVAFCVDYKGLALDTKLATPTGWTTMGQVQVGDTLFDMDGTPCEVTGKSEVKKIDCYRVTFDDKSSVVCDHEHLWRLSSGDVQRVTDIDMHGKRRPYIDVAKPLITGEVELPIDPYVLGLWIADGTRGTGNISKPDDFVWAEIQRRGYKVNMESGVYVGNTCPTRTVKGLRTQLIAAGWIKDKRIPDLYLRASIEQRLDMLRGLMDGDGSANPARHQCVYMTTDPTLAGQVAELLRSLGQRPSVAHTRQTGFGLTVSAYPVSFRPIGFNPFSLPRKAARVTPDWGPGRSTRRRIQSIEQVKSVPTQCISVDSPSRTFLCTEHMIPTHNTGKSSRYADTGQLELMSLMIFVLFPEIKEVRGKLLFVVPNEVVEGVYLRKDRKKMWADWLSKYSQLTAAYDNDVWNAKPSGLCRNYCPVTECPHCG
jgi:hypothetical protein